MNFESKVWLVFFIFLIVRCEGAETGTAAGEMVKAYREAAQ